MKFTVFIYRPRVLIVVSVLLLHALALWGLQSGLLQRVLVLAEDIVVPVTVITEAPPVSKPAPLRLQPAAKTPQSIQPRPAAPAPVPVAAVPVAAQPLAIADPTPAANAPQGVQHAAAPAVVAAPAAAPTTKVELPSTNAEYLHNPKPKYPTLSLNRNEQGTVVLSVLVGVDGRAKDVKVKTSSGFERLDRAAREAVLVWTFVPGKRAGVADEMWFELSMPFKITE